MPFQVNLLSEKRHKTELNMTGKRLGKIFLTDGLRLSDTTERIEEQRAFYTQAKRRRALNPIRQISTDIYPTRKQKMAF